MTKPCPWDDCIYPSCNAAMGCEEDQHTEQPRLIPTMAGKVVVIPPDGRGVHERDMTEEEQWKHWRHLDHISPKR